jgi:hypothetical protein
MRTRLRRTCHAVVLCICNSRLPFRTHFLALRLKVASTCRTASPLTLDGRCFSSYRCVPGFLSCQTTSVSMLEEVDPCETAFWGPAEHWCMNLFSLTQSRKVLLYGRRHFRKLGSLAIKIRNMEVYCQFWNLWKFDFPLTPLICGYAW